MNNLPKVVTQQRRGRDSNPRLLDRKSDALPLSHRATCEALKSEPNVIQDSNPDFWINPIRIPMSAGSLPECCEFISLSVVKISR